MFAVFTDSSDEESMKIKADVNQYFKANVDEARVLLAGADEMIEDEDDSENGD